MTARAQFSGWTDDENRFRMSSATPLVSVIIPTRNRIDLLLRAVRSVQRQTYPHLEIIVVDDGSTDGTSEVIEALGDPRIRCLRHHLQRGGGAARNTGIGAATGELIAFLDDDDEWLPEKTEEQLRVLKGFDAVACSSVEYGREGADSARRPSDPDTLALKDLRDGPWGGTGVLMARADVVKSTLFDETLPMGQDWDFFIRLALTRRIAYLAKPLLRYNGGDHPRITNARRNVPIAGLEQQLRVVHKHRQLFGTHWFKRQMCRGMLYGIKDRPDKLTLLGYTARRYGVINVMRAMASRARARRSKAVHRGSGGRQA